MNKEQAIDLLMLLSALESWAFSNSRIPDYLQDRMADHIQMLRSIALGERK